MEGQRMNDKEIQEFLAKYGSPAIERDRPIGSRRYNLIAWRYENGERKEVGVTEYLTKRQANEFKAEYLKEGIFCDIIEDVSTDRNGKEIQFTEKPEHPVVVGRTQFDTPAATKLIIERDRRNNRKKASFRNALVKKNKGLEGLVRYTGSWADKDSSLHGMYIDNLKRRGYTVIDRRTHTKFIGLLNEVRAYLMELLNSGYSKDELEIIYTGSEK